MEEINLQQLRRYVSGFPCKPKRTTVLEQTIKIGTGFHNKWYGSQKEHWLGWLSLKLRENEIDGKSFEPRKVWSGLKCSPMLFWMAEVSGANGAILDKLEFVSIEAATLRSKDGNPHGVEFRKILPWNDMENLLFLSTFRSDISKANQMGDEALKRLIGHLPQYKRYHPDGESG